MKLLIALTGLSLGLASCGKEDKRPAEPPVAASAAETASRTASTPASASPQDGSGRGSSGSTASRTSYTVVRGDTLAAIGRAHGVSAADLARWNDVGDPRRLRIGQQLRLTAP